MSESKTPKKRNPKFCVAAAAGWRAVYLTPDRTILTLPIAYFNVYADGSTEGVVLGSDSFDLVRAGQPNPAPTNSAPTERVLVGYCSPGETTVRFERTYAKKDTSLGVMRG